MNQRSRSRPFRFGTDSISVFVRDHNQGHRAAAERILNRQGDIVRAA
jgi:hypothetical protein